MLKGKNSRTTIHENEREERVGISRSYFKTRQKFGRIVEVNEDRYVAVIQLDEGGLANGGDTIPITNSWLEMIFQFGPLRKNLRVVVEYEGDQDNMATAKVIGLERELIAQEQESAETDTALYEIFQPGI